ncbi:hypothetical protein Patl1_04482 [Pistacia atlantica]|uniref:Uncharacterized protein n=1 Tax=Pistacia atlantica TaxID=434234 RepID=A0ACC1BWN4_9ROSI|nr:hypothetical protein Patl1_04482 [Pistacia atlantica]
MLFTRGGRRKHQGVFEIWGALVNFPGAFCVLFGGVFLGHAVMAWKLWNEGKPLELIDPVLGESCHLSEVIRCIHVSLLCVQQYPEDRPNMSSTVLMLGSDGELTEPKQPGFLMDRKLHETGTSSGKPESSSTNEITISLLEAR